MGLFSAIAMLPLAPVRGVVWVADQVAQEAERELYGEESIRRELVQARMDYDAGLIDEEEHERRVDELAARLAAARGPAATRLAMPAHEGEEAAEDG